MCIGCLEAKNGIPLDLQFWQRDELTLVTTSGGHVCIVWQMSSPPVREVFQSVLFRLSSSVHPRLGVTLQLTDKELDLEQALRSYAAVSAVIEPGLE